MTARNRTCPFCQCTVRMVSQGGTGVELFRVDGRPIVGHEACRRLRVAAVKQAAPSKPKGKR